MKNIRRGFVTAACAVITFGLASGVGSATTIDSFETATGGVPAFSAPPNPNTAVATVAQFSQAAANAAIAAACPLGFVCSTATLYEVDLGLSANTSGSLDINNANATSQNVGCINGAPGATCSGAGATATNGVAAEGTLSLNATDPLANDVLALVNAPTFTIATNGVQGSGAGKNNFLTVVPGTTPFSGTGTATDPLGEVYDSSDATWAAEMAAYTGAGNVTLNLSLTGASQIGSSPAGVSTSANVDSITGGSVTAQYDYSYTETSIVPEPATLFLMGSALVGVGLLRKRINKS